MATLPDATALGLAPAQTPGRKAIAGYDGGQVSSAFGQLGRAVGQFADEAQREESRVREAAQRAQAGLALAKTNNALHDAYDDVQRRVTGGELDPDKAGETLQERINGARESGLASLSDEQRGLVADNIETTSGNLLRSLGGVVTKRRQSEIAASIDQFGDEVQRDAARLGAGWAAEKYAAFVDFNADAAGIPPEQKQKLKQSFVEGVNFSSLQTMGADAYKAGDIKRLTDVRVMVRENPHLDQAKKTQLDNQLFVYKNTLRGDAERAMRESEAQAEKRIKAAESATRELSKFVASGSAMDADYQVEVMSAVAGTPFEAPARMMIGAAAKGAGFGAQPLPAQAEALRRMDAAAAQGTSPDEKAVMQYVRGVHEAQSREYKENPWAAATKFARAEPVPEVEIKSADMVPALVAQRLRRIGDVEHAAGVAASPLQPNEARAFADSLGRMEPGQRAVVLGQVGAQLPVERIAALADQLDKNSKPLALSLKLGTDKTTAGRATSELVLRGAQAIADKAIKKDDAALTGWRSEISAMVRGALGDERAEQDIIDAAYYVRAAMDLEGVGVEGFKLDASNRGAVSLVIGEPMERGGVKTLLPRGMKEDQFDDKLRELTPDTLRTMVSSDRVYVRGRAVPVEQLSQALQSMGMRRDGRGRYIPVASGQFVTLDPEGLVPLALELR